jgi:hypothetical protein
MSTPMPNSSGQFAVMALSGTPRPIRVNTKIRIPWRAGRGPRTELFMIHNRHFSIKCLRRVEPFRSFDYRASSPAADMVKCLQ